MTAYAIIPHDNELTTRDTRRRSPLRRRRRVDGGEAFDVGGVAWGHDDAAPAAAGEFEHGPDEAEGAGLVGEAADHFGAAAVLDEGAFEQVRGPDPLAVLRGPAQVRDERV